MGGVLAGVIPNSFLSVQFRPVRRQLENFQTAPLLGEIIANLLLLVVIPDRCPIILAMGVRNHRNAPPEGRPGENPDRNAPAAQDDDDPGVDRAGVAHRNQDTSVSSGALARKGDQKEPACELTKLRTDPVPTPFGHGALEHLSEAPSPPAARSSRLSRPAGQGWYWHPAVGLCALRHAPCKFHFTFRAGQLAASEFESRAAWAVKRVAAHQSA